MDDNRPGRVNAAAAGCGVVRRDPEEAGQPAAAIERFVGDTCCNMGRSVHERAGLLNSQRLAACYLARDEEVARRGGAHTQCVAKSVALARS